MAGRKELFCASSSPVTLSALINACCTETILQLFSAHAASSGQQLLRYVKIRAHEKMCMRNLSRIISRNKCVSKNIQKYCQGERAMGVIFFVFISRIKPFQEEIFESFLQFKSFKSPLAWVTKIDTLFTGLYCNLLYTLHSRN